MNWLHPIYQAVSFQPGSRIDVERMLPASLDTLDGEALFDFFSEPPVYQERVSPVCTQIGDDVVRGRNWTEMLIRSFRVYGRIWSRLSVFAHAEQRTRFGEPGMLPFLSLCVEPDMLHRIIEYDYEVGENTYAGLMQLIGQGALSPCATSAFGAILPLLDPFDRRMAIRMGLTFHAPVVALYQDHLKKTLDARDLALSFWLPEGAYCEETLAILHEEFQDFSQRMGFGHGHLILLLDSSQADSRETDTLMKSWNQAQLNGSGNGHGEATISIIFRDRVFSEWASYASPSVKKLLDRTIAKVDSELNAQKIDYCWGHFEDLEALRHTTKSALFFEQKIQKLLELGYLPLTPDIFVRRKMNGRYSLAPGEPHPVSIVPQSAARTWAPETSSFSRWLGLQPNGSRPQPEPPRPYRRLTRDGEVVESGSQVWKIGYNRMRRAVFDAVRGDVRTLKGGLLGTLARMLPDRGRAVAARNIEAFLGEYALIYWREHFLQHDWSEADIHIQDIAKRTLFRGVRGKPSAEQCAVAGACAQAYCFALDSFRSTDTRQTNFDQRAVYQNTVMLTLAAVNMIHVFRWLGDGTAEKAMFRTLSRELLDFSGVWKRHRLSECGVREEEWRKAVVSHVEECPLNCVERAARRVAARHLRPLGYRKEFTRLDESLTANVGHIWDREVHGANVRWDNELVCGALDV